MMTLSSLENGMTARERFRIGHIEGRGVNLAGAESFGQGCDIDNRSSGHIHQRCCGLHGRQFRLPNESACLGCQRHGQDHVIRR